MRLFSFSTHLGTIPEDGPHKSTPLLQADLSTPAWILLGMRHRRAVRFEREGIPSFGPLYRYVRSASALRKFEAFGSDPRVEAGTPGQPCGRLPLIEGPPLLMSSLMEIKTLDDWLPHKARKAPCTTLVLHATAGGSATGAIATLRQRGLSYHFIVPKTGDPIKCAPLSKVAYHAGASWGPDGLFVNRYSIGVSFVNLNDGEDPYTPWQTEVALWIAQQCKVMYPGIKWVTTHAIISPGRKTDPKGYDLDAFAAKCGLRAWRKK